MSNKKNKTHTIKFRLTDIQFEELRKKSIEFFSGNISEVVRQSLLSTMDSLIKMDKKKQKDNSEEVDLLRKIRAELNKIGININQITKHINEQKMFSNELQQPQLGLLANKLNDTYTLIDTYTTYLDRIIIEIKGKE